MMGGEERKKLFSLSDMVEILNPISIVNRGARGEIDSVVIDSREVKRGSLFVPLPGLNTNGHNFLLDAVRGGASAVLIGSDWIDDVVVPLSETLGKYGSVGIVVEDPLRAMQNLARFHLRRCEGVYRVGITGSNGKTTTKEMIASILSISNRVSYNEKNFNSVIGLPLSVFKIKEHSDYIVFEMATNHLGEMAVLADLFEPQAALITNIGTAHIGNFGSREAIAREKRDIFKNFNGNNNLAFVFEEDDYFDFLTDGLKARIVPFGEGSTAGYEGSEDLGLDGYTIYWEGLQIHIPFVGRHNLMNALAAITVTGALGVDKSDVKMGLERVKPLFGRSEVVRGNCTFIVDCYNANPDSMKRSVESFESIKWPSRKVAVLGEMYELGDFSHEEHYRVALDTIRSKLDIVIFLGEEFMEIKGRFDNRELENRKAGKVVWIRNFDELVKSIRGIVRDGDLILLKASRGVELERIIPAIEKNVA